MWQDALIFTGISAAPPFAITTAVMPYLLKRLKEAGIVGVDVNNNRIGKKDPILCSLFVHSSRRLRWLRKNNPLSIAIPIGIASVENSGIW